MTKGSIPVDDNYKPVLALYDDATGNIYPIHIGAKVTGSDGLTYAKLDVNASVSATVASVGANGSAIPTSSDLLGASDGTNLQQLLVESASQRNLRIAVFNGANEMAVDSSGRLTLIPNSSMNVSQVGGGNTATAAAGTQLVGVADGTGNALTSNSTTYTAKKALDGNLLGTLGTAFSTAGKVDVKIASTDQGSATGAAVPANSMYQGVNASTALPTAASAGNLTGVTGDKYGRPVTLAGTIRDLRATQTTTISASTSETTIFTAVASVFLDVVLLIFSNTSATATRIDIRDTTAGTILGSVYVPAGDMRGFAVPGETIPQTSTNTNWTAQCGTSVTDIRVYALVDKNK